MNDTTKKLDDFGEVIHGAKKHNFADLDLSNEDTKKLPFSKLWPKSEIDAIEDAMVAAVAHHARNSIPTKPRKSLAKERWFQKLEAAQTAVSWLIAHPESSKDFLEKLEAGTWNDRLSAFAIQMMAQTDRKHWDKMAFDVRLSQFIIQIGSENHRFNVADVSTANIADVVTAMKPAVQEALANFQEAPPKQKELQFSVYRNTATNEIFIAVKSDKHKTPLINFDTVEEARNYLRNEDADIRRENVENLYQLWQEHKELNNIVKADMRSAENTARIGMGYRDGRDITPEEFLQTFNVRGGQFGNWVKGDERQEHLNQAYDAFMDLSKAANISPSAIGLNGELGIAFGARGSGWAAAHYETDQKVINLTKTKGAGSLAHEWWHALDHYLGDKDLATRDITTIRPENMRHAELSTALQALLKATSNTGLQQRSIKADGYRNKPYFGTYVEMTARAFESYIANKLAEQGIKNDYLVNIAKFEEWKRNPDAYVYLKDDELEAFSQAYDHVFDKLAEVDKSFQREARAMTAEQLQELQSNLDRINDYEPDNNQFAAFAYVQSAHIAKLPSDRQLAASEQALEWIHEVYRGSFSFKNMINSLPDQELAAQIGVYANTPKEDWRYIDKVAVEMDVIEVHITNGEVRRQMFSTNLANATEWVAENSHSFIEQAKAAEQASLAEKSVEATSEVVTPAPAEQAQVIVQTQDKVSAIRAMADEYMVANGFTVENGNYKYISANGDDRKVVDFDGIYHSVHDKLPDNFIMSDFHSTMMKVGWYEIHDFKNPTVKSAEQVTEPVQTADQPPEFGQSADMDAPSENEKELPPQHPVEIPADDKGSKLGSSKSDEYLQKIADRILEQVKNNKAPWQMPFEAGTVNNVLPVSGASGTPYKGLNSINLMVQASINGYNDNRWFTYNNAQEAGGQVRRGEKGTQIHFWHIPTKEDVEKEQTKAAAEGREPKNLSPKLRIYTVFNAEQIDGLPERQLNETLLTKFERHEKAESILENSGVRIDHTPEKTGHYSAHYNPRTDTITLPQRELFVSEDAYYATALHELAHSTGHESRLNRDLSGAFGSYSYAKEELRAEMASMMIGQELQIGHDPTNHYAYLQSWAAVIENDPKEFFKAAKDADLITKYVLSLDKTKEKVAEVEQRQGVEQAAEVIAQSTPAKHSLFVVPNDIQEQFGKDVAKLNSTMVSYPRPVQTKMPPVLLALDGYNGLSVKDLPLELDRYTLLKMQGKVAGKDDISHTLSLDDISKLLKEIHDPVAVVKADNGVGLVVLTSIETKHGDPIIVPIHLEKEKGKYVFHDMASAFGHVNLEGWLHNSPIGKENPRWQNIVGAVLD
ncbi:hypothetical protein B0181_11030 [Moraxella caviae]|uniref:DNA primase TraC n=1 Tax=Moraxella caviae TaxID=34060 RepID=A0A1S9ZVU7_9GAMM|nr:zincin-like metallopeptidase domain-containing protein [Moraxella caviae]OOR87101.1 hypothetical protein B0181_11030 [Moraxella caviae]STZ13631.1 DNA primase TraC [Moraxella caviae]